MRNNTQNNQKYHTTMKTRRQRHRETGPQAAAAAAATSSSPPSPAAAIVTSDDDDSPVAAAFSFDGRSFATYQAMVDAKRRRNRDVLASSGLLAAKRAVESSILNETQRRRPERGLKRAAAATGAAVVSSVGEEAAALAHYNNRINDGSDLSVAAAVETAGSKWATPESMAAAERFMSTALEDINDDLPLSSRGGRAGQPASVVQEAGAARDWRERLDALSLDDEACVAKVVPERIMSVACHPSPEALIACAGDKMGHLGIWNVDRCGMATSPCDAASSVADGGHLFRPHRGPLTSLVWTGAGALLTASYDGTVRRFDAARQAFEEVFATYDESAEYRGKLGYGTDRGHNCWVQSMEVDRRNEGGSCFFLSTSRGGVIHVDTRDKGKVTFDATLSEKKINTVSLHPNGHTLATAGLSTVVQLWDVRKVGKKAQPLAWQHAGRSINSAYFSPSGRRLLATTQSNHLDILKDAHLSTGLIKTPHRRLRHDNQTGRWLSTFMAKWHPTSTYGDETFVVGSMKKPRTIEVFDGEGRLVRELTGEGLTSVASRCTFHPSADAPVVVGGTSSGRVTVAR